MPTDELWIIFGLVFGAALLAIQGTYWFMVRTRQDQKAINRRVALGSQLDSAAEVLETLRRERGLASVSDLPLLQGLDDFVVQTGLSVDLTRLFMWVTVVAVGLLLALSYVFGFGIVALVMSMAMALAGVLLFLIYVRRKRITRFGEQLPDALDVIVRGLRAGHPFRVAVGLVGREMSDPIGTEFGLFLDEITFGLDVNAAVTNLCRRVGHEDLSFFAITINIQSQTGGNLAEILSRLSQLIRSRAKMRLKIRALTSEGRLSAVFLSLAPFILFAIISLLSPPYFWEIRDHPIVQPALFLGLFLLAAGNVIMYRMVNFKI
jgi:tight adherence protein B